ncbi:MAG: hypothetical protein IKD62_05395 [Oscillospiraceae bacterium]|nr:hypothetical protein [Oscillospiraceae bacterium]
MKAIRKLLALALCLITLFSFIPAQTASADSGDTVTIESQTNSAFDYLEYYSNGKWKDLNTPKHWIESTGQVCYCIEHTDGNPHGATYTAAPPSSVFSTNTLQGLLTILMYGYPCNTPDGFTEDEARQATANAIRFWLSENGEPGSYSFTNRKTHPNAIRAKKGYEHVLTWADELLQMARDKKTLSHSIEFTPSALTLTKSGSNFTGKTTVKLTNINSGYTLDTSGLPSGVTVTGYTGTKSEQLTITAPASAAGKTFTISATGKDTRSLDNITAYVPSNSSLQKIFLCATTAQVVATASFGVNTPALGALKIKKVGDDSTPLAGVKFGIYKDANCSQKVTEVTTGNDGTATVSELDAGTYYVKELSTVKPYVVDGLVHSVIVVVSETTTLELENETAKGAIRVLKTAYVLTGTTASNTEYGQLHSPKYEVKGLPGCVFVVKNADGTVVATLTTDETGVAETPLLPFGTYTVQETATVTGYDLDASIYTVTIAYKDQNTPIVYAEVSANNKRIPGSVKIKKTCEFFDTETMTFKVGPLAGAVFGLYTAENISVIPKNTLVDLLTTDENGVATSVTTLPFGKYYLKELKVPDETIHLIEESFPVTVSGANTQYFKNPIENERFKGNIAIWKEDDSNPGRMLEGAQYEIRDKDGLLYCTMTTDKDGYACSIDLPVGTYYVKEVVPPAGFILSDEVIEVEITTDDKATIVFERTNEQTHIVLHKTDLTTGKPVYEAVIKITNSEGKVIFEDTTDLNGEIILYELPADTYTFQETVAADGFTLNPETFTFTVDYYGNITGTTEITDEPICLQINKVNLYTGQPFANVEFRLVDSEGQTVRTVLYTPEPEEAAGEEVVKRGPASEEAPAEEAAEEPVAVTTRFRVWAKDGEDTFFTDENGFVEFRYLPAGTYTLEEVYPTGYIGPEVITFTLTDKDGVSSPKVVTVENCPTGLKIIKVDAKSGNPLAGAGFCLKIKGETDFEILKLRKEKDGSYFYDPNGSVTDMITDGTGEIVIYGLPLGTVWIEESITPDGYFPISAQKVELTRENTNSEPLTFRIENHKFVKLGMDSDWWEFPALCGGVLLLLGGLVAAAIIVAKKRKRLREEA